MENKIPQDNNVLALTEENLRLVNIYLLSAIENFDPPSGIKGVHKKLDASIKGNDTHASRLNYGTMRKAIERDLKTLSDVPDNKNKFKNFMKILGMNGKQLQIRITANHFLLNYILKIIGVSFENLFDKSNFPTEAEEFIIDFDTHYEQEDINQEQLFLLNEINQKVDEIILKYTGPRIRKTYMDRFTDLKEFLFLGKCFIESLYEPNKFGFSTILVNKELQKKMNQEIYLNDYFFIMIFMNDSNGSIHKRSEIYKSFEALQKKNLIDNVSEVKRMISPFFMIGILEYLFIRFLKSGINNKKGIFHIGVGNISDYSGRGTSDTKKILDKVENSHKKTIGFIKHVLDSDIRPTDDLCIKYETIFVSTYEYVFKLFQNTTPNLFTSSTNVNDIEKQIREMFTPGVFFSFYVNEEQLGFLDRYITKLEELQDGLEPFYMGNDDVLAEEATTGPKTGIEHTSIRNSPTRGN